MAQDSTVGGKSVIQAEIFDLDGHLTAPAVSPPGEARLYYDSMDDELYLSKDGAAYATIGAGGSVDDTVYGVSWNGVTDTAPSKNAVYDKIESIAGGGFDSTTIDNPTWSDGTEATLTHSFDMSGTDYSLAFSSDKLTLSGDLTLTTGKNLTLGTTQWDNGADKIDGEQVADDTIDDDSLDLTDITLADFTFDVGSVDTTEFGYLNGVTSAIQTQLNAKQAADADLDTWAGITPGANVGTFLATPSSANLASAVTGETGTGNLVFNTNPSLAGVTLTSNSTISDGAGDSPKITWQAQTATGFSIYQEDTTDDLQIDTNTASTETIDITNAGAGDIQIIVEGNVEVTDEAYGVGWDSSTEVPTKNALYDKIETISGGSFDATAQDALTWSDGANATNAWTFDISGTTDPVITFGDGYVNVSTGELREGGNAVVTANEAGSVFQAYDADLTTYAGITPSANVQSLLGAATYAAMRTLLDLEVGTDFYSISAADTQFEEEVTEGSLADQTIVTADIKEGTILSGDLSWDAALTDGDYVTYDSTGTNFNPLSAAEVLADIGAESSTSNDFDPDRLAGDATDDNLVDSSIVENSSNWDTAYTHSQDNTQAHSDYLLNSGNDTMAGILTADGLTLGDDENITLGTSSDWTINFDDSVDDQLLIQTAKTSAIATTDPMVEILVDTGAAGMTADQQIFGVAVGSQATNTPKLTLDEDGDFVAAGSGTFGGSGASSFASDINPDADSTRDLGTQTTLQWANVWADLVNGADISMANKWRMLESELYLGYPQGWAIGYDPAWEDGVSLWVHPEMIGNGKPILAVTEEFIEYRGTRITPKQFRVLARIASWLEWLGGKDE